MSVSKRWEFSDPPNVAVVTTRAVIDGDDWISFASRAVEDGGWQFVGPSGADLSSAMVVSLQQITDLDRSIFALADLRPGQRASRASVDEPWIVSR